MLVWFATIAFAVNPTADPQAAFWDALSKHCGQAATGKVVLFDEQQDQDWANATLHIRIGPCEDDRVQIALAVDDDTSRTWFVHRHQDAISLKHRHAHDGHEDAVSWYGGTTTDTGTSYRQTFPVDAYSQALFIREGLVASTQNLWSLEVSEDHFAYELVRPGRLFRAEFEMPAQP